MRTRSAGLALAVLALAGCSDDGGAPDDAGGGTTLDPGVTFEEDVTVPTDAAGDPDPSATTTTLPGGGPEVSSLPGEVPEEFPPSFPVPDGAEVEIGSISRVEGELRMAVDYGIAEGDPAQVHRFYRNAVTALGFSTLLDDDAGAGQDYIGQMVFETDAYVGNVLVSGDGDDGVLLTLTATLPD